MFPTPKDKLAFFQRIITQKVKEVLAVVVGIVDREEMGRGLWEKAS
jgi:hypothetical protein